MLNMSNILNISKINELAKKTHEWEEAVIRNNMKFHYKPVFSQDQKNQLLIDFQEFIKEASNRPELNPILTDDKFFYLVYYFIVREFTDILVDVGTSVEETVSAYSNLVDSGIFDEILKELPSAEIASVLNSLFEYIQNIREFMLNEKDIKNQVENLRIKHTNLENNRKIGALNAIV